MLPEDWGSGFGRTIGVFYNGHGIQEQDSRGRRITDDSFLLGFNAHDDDVDFALPAEEYSRFWDVLVDTADQADTEAPLKAGSVLKLAAKSMVVLRAHSGPEVEVDYSAAASLAAMAEHEDSTGAGSAAPAPEAPAARHRKLRRPGPDGAGSGSPGTPAPPRAPRKPPAQKGGGRQAEDAEGPG